MFRKARLKRSFQQIFRLQLNGDENLETAAASPSGLEVLHRPGVEHLGVARAERRIPVEQADPPPQLEEIHPMRVEDAAEPRSPQNPAPDADSPQPPQEDEDDAERARRRILLRRFFQAARRRDYVGRTNRLDLGQGGTPAAAGGAPCFTVGGSGTSSVASASIRGQPGPGDLNPGVLADGNGEARLRRANLLRRILHALRCVSFTISGCCCFVCVL